MAFRDRYLVFGLEFRSVGRVQTVVLAQSGVDLQILVLLELSNLLEAFSDDLFDAVV